MTDRDQHLVQHDCAILGVALALAVISVAATGNKFVFAATFFTVAASGIGLMRIGATRRLINDGVSAISRKGA
ncbi:hypothetical protein [Streptomyces sp. 5-10]|uniref:hypothetical protein n=1 Tax=Streptomyces sp. 5-10 TaxID=878925 RepID=UPI00168BDCF6|nr:hypothetical protein [Streptomyces sp. 5-10]MBD3004789.1 hypothetical protein [Streptomyces sp. 5-10]